MTATHFPFLPGLDLSEALYREAVRRELPREVRGFPIDLARRDAEPSGDRPAAG